MINSLKKQNGFTLLEMLVALGLTAILLSGVFLLINQSARLWNTGAETIESNESEIIAVNFIRKILEQAKPVDWRREAGVPATKIFEGEKDQVYFAAPLPVHDGQGAGLYLFSLSVSYSKEYQSSSLIASYWDIDWESLDKTLENEPKKEVILTNVEGISISYYGDKDYSDGQSDPEWTDEWVEVKDLPLAVSFDMKRSKATDDNDVPVDLVKWSNLVIRLPHQKLR